MLKIADKTLRNKNDLGKYLSENLVKVLVNASKIAIITNRKTVGVRQLLAALFLTGGTAAYQILTNKLGYKGLEEARRLLGVNPESLVKKLEGVDRKSYQDIILAHDTKEILLEAARLASKIKSRYIGTEHLLISLIVWGTTSNSSLLKPYLERIPDVDGFISNILTLTQLPMLRDSVKQTNENPSTFTPLLGVGETKNSGSYVKDFTYDINRWFSKNTLGVLYDRNKYVQEVIKGLIDPINNSVLLVGPSGVGKTFIAYSVAKHLKQADAPIALHNATVLSINLPKIIATAKFPTDVEKSVMGILSDASGLGNVVLFFDDFQYLVSPVIRGGMNMRPSIKKLIETRSIKIIATMSNAEYELVAGQDPEFMRLFKVIRVTEPAETEVLAIMKMYLQKFSEFFPIRVQKKALNVAINLLDEYLPTLHFPDKAVRFLGELFSQKVFTKQSRFKNLGLLEQKIAQVENAKQRFVDLGQYEEAHQARGVQEQLKRKLRAAVSEFNKESKRAVVININDVRMHIAKLTGIPVETLSSDETSMLLHLEDSLKKHIVSQQEAIKKVAYAVKRGRLGIVSRNRPWATFLFLGPTGVGKTELAKALARNLFGDDKKHLIQIDMSELMEGHSVSKLIGAPPGYVGFQQGGILTNKIKEQPHSVVLFDEIEKAADPVLNILLQILEEGHLTDSRGETVSFANTIIVLTSNIGAEKIFEDKVLGFYRESVSTRDLSQAYESMRIELLAELKKKIRPELLNRLDDIIIFRTLTLDDGKQILEILLNELNERLVSIGVRVTLTVKAKRFVLKKGFNQEYGARPLRRELQHSVENLLADYLLSHHELYSRLKVAHPKVFTIDYNARKKTLFISKVE